MGNKASVFLGLVVVASFFANPTAQAGDRKAMSDALDSGLFDERVVGLHASFPARHATFGSSVGAVDARAERFVEAHSSTTADERERATGPIDRKITLLRFETKRFGEIGVHPLLGGVKGLQVSVGF